MQPNKFNSKSKSDCRRNFESLFIHCTRRTALICDLRMNQPRPE